MKPTTAAAALWCSLVYAAFLLLVFLAELATHPLATDDGLSYFHVSAKSFSAMLDSFEAGVNVLPYSYFVALWGLDKMVGLGPATVRLLSFIFALATVFLFHKLLRARFGDPIAFVVCVAVLLLPKDIVRFASDARPYSLYLLAAAFCLFACVARIEAESETLQTFLLTAAAAFALPSVHYVGGFYSLSALVALLYVQRQRGRPIVRTAVSFAVGWLAFAVVHFAQIRMFAQRKSVIDPTWIPRPSTDDVLEIAARVVTFPPLVCVVVLAILGLTVVSASGMRHETPTHRAVHNLLDTNDRSATSFLFVVSLLWILMPIVFYGFGLIGLANLSLYRYFSPSQLAIGSMAALLLAALSPAPGDVTVRASGPVWRRFAAASVVVTLVFLAVPATAAAAHFLRARAYVWRPSAISVCAQPGGAMCVTNNLPVFVHRAFYLPDEPPVVLLRKTQREVDGFKQFDRRLPVIAVTELARLPRFTFLYQRGTVNSFPDFDIRAWGKANGYEIVEEGQRDNVMIFDAKRS